MKKIIILLAVLFNFTIICEAQDEKGITSLNEVKDISLQVTENFKNKEITEAFVTLRRIWILNETEINRLESTVKEQQSVVYDNYGESIGINLVQEELVDGVIYKLTYVVRHEWHGMKLTFIYYYGKGDTWYLNNFNWDDKISELVD